MNKQEILLTKQGMKALRKSIKRLDRQRKRLILRLKDVARAINHENTLNANEIRHKIRFVESELYEQRQKMRHAKILPKRMGGDIVRIGSQVRVRDDHGAIKQFRLVDTLEANPSSGKISVLSPLGRSMLGHKINDTIMQTINGKSRFYMLQDIL